MLLQLLVRSFVLKLDSWFLLLATGRTDHFSQADEKMLEARPLSLAR